MPKLPSDEYFAGLFDGEGSFCAVKRNYGYTFRATLGMCDKEPVHLLYQRFGGSMSFRKPLRGGWRGVYIWDSSGYQAIAVAKALAPFLVAKKAHADLMLQAESLIRPLGVPASGKPLSPTILQARRQIAEKLRLLNKRGVSYAV